MRLSGIAIQLSVPCLLILLLIPTTKSYADEAGVDVVSGDVKWSFNPENMKLVAQHDDDTPITVSAAANDDSPAWKNNNGRITWRDKDLRMRFTAVAGDGLRVDIATDKPQTFTWPVFELKPARDRLIWPRGEGLLIPVDDNFWQKEIFQTEWDAAESLSLPLWGVRQDDHVVSWLTQSPFRNTIEFVQSTEGFRLEVNQEFTTKSEAMKVSYRFFLDRDTNPLIPARRYRQYLEETEQLVTLADKVKQTTAVARLKGATHAYLWGAAPVCEYDIPRAKWRDFCRKLSDDARSSGTMGEYLKTFFTAEQWKAVEEITKTEWPYKYVKGQVCAGLSQALESDQFLEKALLLRNPDNTNEIPPDNQIFAGSILLKETYDEYFIPVKKWGNGISLKMLDALKEASLDRLKLCVPDHAALAIRPWVAAAAKENGWLIGTYDSYHSIHSPDEKPDDTWETAQMTRELYENASVRDNNGDFISGFRGVGRKLNSLAGRSFMEKRVTSNMKAVPYNYYFIDCDATGEIYDDFDPAHPISREQDAAARLDRLEWISNQFNCVIGSEGGKAFAVPAIHVAEGVFGPYFGWDEPAMKDPDSPFFRGRYYPPDGPDVFFKPVRLKERFQKLFYDPTHKIPLYATVFHDCVIATYHWNNGHFKYPEVQAVAALTEILYLAPPMYHFNLEEFRKRKQQVTAHYNLWSPLHEKYGFEPLTDFQWLTEDRTVQQAHYGSDCEITVNFGTSAYKAGDMEIPPMSALLDAPAIWKQPRIYTPEPVRNER